MSAEVKTTVVYFKGLFDPIHGLEKLNQIKKKYSKEFKFVEYLKEVPSLDGVSIGFLDLQTAKSAQQKSKLWCYLNESIFDYCFQAYIFKDEFLNNDFFCLPIYKLNQDDFPLFCKPVKLIKPFGGMVLKDEHDIPSIKYLTNAQDFDLVILSQPKQILREFRFFICNDEIVTSSEYGKFNPEPTIVPESAYAYVKSVIKPDKSGLDEKIRLSNLGRYVIDIAEVGENQFKVVELNCFHTSGFYHCDFEKILLTLTKGPRRDVHKE